ncbi:phosphotriesterase family protein [Phytoactinopolyspora limicola]|uniref:phosphotriesterase family protein n=1 Tax=Phytoactinopolyspora limicola TaxID=2715536 RepID=UPI00140D7CDB|nr:aryldialkylphosphatase [Phytoactinopolyspora limicola]
MITFPADIPNLSGKVLTVTGPADPETLGVVSMHEHIFLDITRPEHNPRPGYNSPAARTPLTLDNLADVRSGTGNIDNDQLGNFDEQLAEILPYRYAGGGTLVDVTNIGLGRDPAALQRISQASGLHIVMGSGWYERNFHPADMDDLTVDDLTAVIVTDVVSGADGTSVRAGIIGEVGVEGQPLTTNELKSVRASGRAAAITGAPITFHRGGTGDEQFAVLDILEEEGVDLRTVVMGHAGTLGLNLDFAQRLLARGVFVEFDFLGAPGSPWGTLWPFTDLKVAEGIANLVAAGYTDQIVLGTDVCTKLQLKRYGGHGYTYLLDHFLPALTRLGVPDAATRAFMTTNAQRALTFSEGRR